MANKKDNDQTKHIQSNCIKRTPFGQRKGGPIRQVTS